MSFDDNVKGLNLRPLVKTGWLRPKRFTCLWVPAWGRRGLGIWNGIKQIHARSWWKVAWRQGCKPLLVCAHTPDIGLLTYIASCFKRISHHSPCALKQLRTERIGPRTPSIWIRAFSGHLSLEDHYPHFSNIFRFGAAFLFSLEVSRTLF